MDKTKFAFDVFLSHNSKDKPQVRKLAEQLHDAGLRVWYDEWLIQAGDDIYLAIERGLETSRTLILCMSPNAFGSDWVGLERSTVLFRDPSNADRRFIPLLLADCELPDTLRRFKYVDYRAEAKAAFADLLAVCGLEAPVMTPAPTLRRKSKVSAKESSPPIQTEPLAVLERKLEGHKNWIRSIAVSPNGTWLASGSDDKTIKIWDMETGECRATLEGHTEEVRALVITHDRGTLFSGSNDNTIRCWQVLTGQATAVIRGHNHFVLGLAVFKHGTRLASCSANEGPPTIRLWNTATHRRLSTFKDEENGFVNSIAVSQNGDSLVSGGSDKLVKVWDVASGALLMALSGHSDSVKSVQITPDCQFAISGSKDKTIKIWNLATQSCVGTLEGHQSDIDSIALSPDGSVLASTGFNDHTVRIWDWQAGICLQIIEIDKVHAPFSVAFSRDGARLVVGTTEGNIFIYRLKLNRSSPALLAPSRYKNAKVVLIGEGTVGKTSLAHRLVDDDYVIQDRTHGMNVWRLDLPDKPSVTDDDVPEEREALLWDLAGQEDYRLIHQLFLSETALALLLINPQKDDPFAEAGDWLKAINTAVNPTNAQRAAAKLLIFSQTDVGGMKLSNSKIDRFIKQHGFAAWLPTSAKTGENCSDRGNSGQASALKQLIAEHIPWHTLPWTSTPRLLTALKNALVAMRDDTDIRLLRFAELAQRLETVLPEEAFSEADIRTAVTLLANHGLVRPLKFGDLVLLRPDLLNGYAGAIIRAARVHSDEIGCVAEADIYHADFDFTGVERLNRADEELLLRALVQTLLEQALCIAEDTADGRHLVFPSQYRRERDIPKHPDIFVSYTFCGEWQSIYTTLIVRLWYSREFGHKELWRNAAEFATSKGHTLGLKIDNKQGEGEATISLFFDVAVPDELKVIFIEYIHRHLAKYAGDVRRDRRYVCSCGKAVTDLDAVRKRFDLKKSFITCQACDERVDLVDFIEQRLASDPVAKEVLRMDATATRELDSQALDQILIGHMMAIAGEANQIFRPVTMFDHGIDGEVEFKDNDGKASGKKIYIQLKSGDSYLRSRKTDGNEIFDLKNERHLHYWQNQPVDVYLVIRQQDERTGEAVIRWMNVTEYLKERQDKNSRQIVFTGKKLDAPEVWRVRDGFFGH